MSEPFLGEVKMFGFSFAPRGWAACDGQLLPIAQNQALFSLLGVTYGGDGIGTFALPNLRGRVPICSGPNIPVGKAGGEETHTLTIAEMPQHTHLMNALEGPGVNSDPQGALLSGEAKVYTAYASPVTMANDIVSPSGVNMPHLNMQPNLAVNFCIALQGIFPSRN